VLAAPDIDVNVAEQRIGGDRLSLSTHRFTVYTSPADKAIGVANTLFQSPRGRVGTLGPDNVTDTIKAAMAFGNTDLGDTNFAVINFSGASDAQGSQGDEYGHSYFRDAPTVSSDLVLLLRDDLNPGDPGRPLKRLGLEFWSVPPGYPGGVPDK
jgi:esterase/lipase superfamily enzyme